MSFRMDKFQQRISGQRYNQENVLWRAIPTKVSQKVKVRRFPELTLIKRTLILIYMVADALSPQYFTSATILMLVAYGYIGAICACCCGCDCVLWLLFA